MTEFSDLGLLLARVLLGAVFIFSAFDKLTHRADAIAELEALKLPRPDLLRPLVIATQMVAGLMVLLGVHARLGALALAAFTALATVLAHRFWEHDGAARRMQMTIALEHLAIVGGLLLLALVGAGRLALMP